MISAYLEMERLFGPGVDDRVYTDEEIRHVAIHWQDMAEAYIPGYKKVARPG